MFITSRARVISAICRLSAAQLSKRNSRATRCWASASFGDDRKRASASRSPARGFEQFLGALALLFEIETKLGIGSERVGHDRFPYRLPAFAQADKGEAETFMCRSSVVGAALSANVDAPTEPRHVGLFRSRSSTVWHTECSTPNFALREHDAPRPFAKPRCFATASVDSSDVLFKAGDRALWGATGPRQGSWLPPILK